MHCGLGLLKIHITETKPNPSHNTYPNPNAIVPIICMVSMGTRKLVVMQNFRWALWPLVYSYYY